MPFNRLIKALLQQATKQGSRSTVLQPLAWIIVICVFAILGSIEVKAPSWIVVMLALLSGLALVSYFVTYFYCLFTGREELLRSETYSIQRLAIEKGFLGDSVTGEAPEDVVTEMLLGEGKEEGEE